MRTENNFIKNEVLNGMEERNKKVLNRKNPTEYAGFKIFFGL